MSDYLFFTKPDMGGIRSVSFSTAVGVLHHNYSEEIISGESPVCNTEMVPWKALEHAVGLSPLERGAEGGVCFSPDLPIIDNLPNSCGVLRQQLTTPKNGICNARHKSAITGHDQTQNARYTY
jgi:hypothetical protein